MGCRPEEVLVQIDLQHCEDRPTVDNRSCKILVANSCGLASIQEHEKPVFSTIQGVSYESNYVTHCDSQGVSPTLLRARRKA